MRCEHCRAEIIIYSRASTCCGHNLMTGQLIMSPLVKQWHSLGSLTVLIGRGNYSDKLLARHLVDEVTRKTKTRAQYLAFNQGRKDARSV